MTLHHVRTGAGRPLLLIHGLGGSHQSWSTVVDELSRHREVIAVDLPGFGDTPPLTGPVSVAALADEVARFIAGAGLDGVDVVGSSLGGQLALELKRRGAVGSVVALDPAGFGTALERTIFGVTLRASMALVRLLGPVLGLLAGNPVTRTLLLPQFSARPWALSPELVRRELHSFAHSPGSAATLAMLAAGDPQLGLPTPAADPVVIVWGSRDWVLFPSQAPRAARAFPGAELQWLRGSGHLPQWDVPEKVIRLVLRVTEQV
jgi:pimeloyl-ACP methyl ester carboxylesterase